MEIRIDDPGRGEVARFIAAHLADVTRHSPPESAHALGIEALRAVGVTFWTAWDAVELLGCGALLELDPRHGEIKSMRTAAKHVRKGVASGILEQILQEAERRAYRRLSLETGSAEVFAPARAFYARRGFVACGPFGDYVLDPHSVFMTRAL